MPFGPHIGSSFADTGLMGDDIILAPAPTHSAPRIGGWHAGGGGVREVIDSFNDYQDTYNADGSDNVAPIDNGIQTLLIRKYLMYGAIAFAGLLIIKRF